MKKPVKDYNTQYPQEVGCSYYANCESSNLPAGPCYPGPAPSPNGSAPSPSGGWGQ